MKQMENNIKLYIAFWGSLIIANINISSKNDLVSIIWLLLATLIFIINFLPANHGE